MRCGATPSLSEGTPIVPNSTTTRFPKELTRSTSSLLVSRRLGVIPMLRARTHFEQVPLESVRKMVEGQVPREIISERDPVTKKKKVEERLQATQEQSRVSSH